MSDYVLDTSALLAAMFQETGADRVDALLSRAALSSVNLSETLAKLADRGVDMSIAATAVERLNIDIIPFDAIQARVCAELRLPTRAAGLSLGDRACIALGMMLGATIVTADRPWASLDLGVPMIFIR